jgi:hypothetical protein
VEHRLQRIQVRIKVKDRFSKVIKVPCSLCLTEIVRGRRPNPWEEIAAEDLHILLSYVSYIMTYVEPHGQVDMLLAHSVMSIL